MNILIVHMQKNKVFFSILLSVFIFSAFFLNYLNVSAADCGGCGQPACPTSPPATSPPATSPPATSPPATTKPSSGATTWYTYKRCTDGRCVNHTTSVGPSADQCSTSADCPTTQPTFGVGDPPYSCSLCIDGVGGTRTCGTVHLYSPCGGECRNSSECQGESGSFAYSECSGTSCVTSSSNYYQPSRCNIGDDSACANDQYHNVCYVTSYVSGIGIWSCRNERGPGKNECTKPEDCSGNDGGGDNTTGGTTNGGTTNGGTTNGGTTNGGTTNGGTTNGGTTNGGTTNGGTTNGGIPSVSPPPAPKCQIFEFSINEKTNEDKDPLFVWVDAVLNGYISVNDSCTTCTVTSEDTWGNPPKSYTITSISTYINETFKIPTSGTYSFKLECIGNTADPDDFDEDTVSLKTVEALNLPWWREIIPVLQGFLRGVWR